METGYPSEAGSSAKLKGAENLMIRLKFYDHSSRFVNDTRCRLAVYKLAQANGRKNAGHPVLDRFMRPQKPYTPPSNATSMVDAICRQNGLSLDDSTKIEDKELRYNVFTQIGDSFNHYIPNSIMHAVETIGDLKNFYCEAIDNVTPLDAMQKMELPKNLHIQYEYVRFHPETDEMFDGKTAFPQSSTLVTGLKYRKKYRGHSQKNPWHHLQKTI